MPRIFTVLLARWREPGAGLPIAIVTAGLAWVALRAILSQTGGEVAVPLDDSFIHFQFARTFATLHPFEYSAGAAPVPGATSLLWPLALAPFHWLGCGGLRIIWVAWALGWLSFGLLAYETWRASSGVLSPESAAAATGMVLAFGGYTWFASSGMEVVPFAWLLMRSARRTAEWLEQRDPAPRRDRAELAALALLTPLMRPEGLVASGLIVVAFATWPRGGSRAWACLPLVGPALPGLIGGLATGQWVTTTAEAKWLIYTPYQHRVPATLRYHLDVFLNTLLDGRVWSAVFLPRGIKWLSWLALPALLLAGATRQRWARALVLVAVGLGMLIPITYDSFLVNRLRYLWPFAAAWFIGVGAIGDALGAALARWHPRLELARLLAGGVVVGALAGYLPFAIDDLATSADAVRQQQVALARWVDAELPADALVGVNDAGALTYLSGRRTFDLVGLTTRGEARHWAAGPGSRFEHYERLGVARLPTHFVVYESWVGLPMLMGDYLTSRTVTSSTILGDATKSAYEASYVSLGSGELPLAPSLGAPRDTLDVADLESEQAHGYALFWATQQDDVVYEHERGAVDGGRQQRTEDRFTLELVGGGQLVARLASGPAELTVRVGERVIGTWRVTGEGRWEELTLAVPAELGGRQAVRISAAPGATFASLHYWSYP